MAQPTRKPMHKLVRDHIPEIIAAEGRQCGTEIMSEDDYRRALLAKLVEEAQEVAAAAEDDELVKEIADLYEVLEAVIAAYDLDEATIREQLQALLREYEPIAPRTWQERLADGETAPYLEIVDKYMDTPLALYAIYTLTTEAEVRKFARDEKQRKMITYYRKKCLKQIEAAYGKAASF